MSFNGDNTVAEGNAIDVQELILLELRVISTLLGEGHDTNTDELRESLINDYQGS